MVLCRSISWRKVTLKRWGWIKSEKHISLKCAAGSAVSEFVFTMNLQAICAFLDIWVIWTLLIGCEIGWNVPQHPSISVHAARHILHENVKQQNTSSDDCLYRSLWLRVFNPYLTPFIRNLVTVSCHKLSSAYICLCIWSEIIMSLVFLYGLWEEERNRRSVEGDNTSGWLGRGGLKGAPGREERDECRDLVKKRKRHPGL